MEMNKALERVLAMVGDLPAMPAVVADVLRITENPAMEMVEASRVIQADPGLTAKILRISNSSYYGMKQYVGTLKLALVILGVREIRNIVIGITVFETLRQRGSAVETAQEIWSYSLRVAGVAKALGTEVGLGLQGEEFIAGLLHDIGKMVLLCQVGEDYARIYNDLRQDQSMLCEAERQEFGFTNADVAMALAVRWNLPQSLSDALWYQYPSPDHPLKDAKDPCLAAVVRIGRCAVRDDFSAPNDMDIASLQDIEAWEALATAKRPVPPGDRRRFLAEALENMSKGPEIPI